MLHRRLKSSSLLFCAVKQAPAVKRGNHGAAFSPPFSPQERPLLSHWRVSPHWVHSKLKNGKIIPTLLRTDSVGAIFQVPLYKYGEYCIGLSFYSCKTEGKVVLRLYGSQTTLYSLLTHTEFHLTLSSSLLLILC